MVKQLKYIFVFLFVLLASTSAFATHIVGGELYYDNLGNNNYRVTLKVFRDCINGQAPFDGQQNGGIAYLHVFDKDGNLIQQIDLGQPIVTPVPPSINNPCIQTPNNVCVEEGKYTYTVNLAPIVGGYHLVYQRCCRNNTILNLTAPGGQGSTYQAFIPGSEVVAVNSSPRYDNFPPIFICNNLKLKFDHKATDPDGDELVYSLCDPFNGIDACCPSIGGGVSSSNFCPNPPANCPTVSLPPPYPTVNFVAPYNGSFPIASNPSLTVNSNTGFLSGTPNINGQWVVSVCVQEFRNGILLSTHYRDFQFNVVSCIVNIVSAVADQPSKCQGDTINFVNNSVGSSTYHWDFGINEIFSDTSNLFTPTYVFPDTGVYNVTLIANPGKPCADTTSKSFYIYPRLNIDFIPQALQCLKNNSFDFELRGSYINSATFNWTFGSLATPSTSTEKDPQNVVYSDAGKYFVKVIGKQFTCIDSFIDSVRVLQRPTAKINNFPTSLCDPAKVAFSNGSVSEYPASYIWETSDSAVYVAYEPTHVFSPVGVYSVTLTLVRGAPCPDTSKTSIQTFTVNPIPRADFIYSPTLTSIFDPELFFENQASNDVIKWHYDFGDGATSFYMNEKHRYQAPGTYTVGQTVTNQYNCSSFILKEVKILPEFRFWIPNTFTPDGNGLNDIFMPSTIGTLEYQFHIFDRWGEKIFSTEDNLKGWDGTYKGKLCQQDVYVWLITFRNEVSMQMEYHSGHVLLMSNLDE